MEISGAMVFLVCVFMGKWVQQKRGLCQYLCSLRKELICAVCCVFSLSIMMSIGRILILVLGLVVFAGGAGFAVAKDQEPRFNATGLKLPRFVSLGADEAHVRAGPATRYPIKWVYNKRGLPVEIVQEFDVWRKVRDRDGEEGWLHKSLLSSRRNVVVLGEEPVAIRSQDSEKSRSIARLEPGVIATATECKKAWCKITASGYEGWAERKSLWGIYAAEDFD